MRLIDADALITQEEYFMKMFKGQFGEEVASHTIEIVKNAPTVEAIPIEWIYEWLEKSKLGHSLKFVVEYMLIADWAEREEE